VSADSVVARLESPRGPVMAYSFRKDAGNDGGEWQPEEMEEELGGREAAAFFRSAFQSSNSLANPTFLHTSTRLRPASELRTGAHAGT
jgi:hypothetical protein